MFACTALKKFLPKENSIKKRTAFFLIGLLLLLLASCANQQPQKNLKWDFRNVPSMMCGDRV
jgi:hypothetical protein